MFHAGSAPCRNVTTEKRVACKNCGNEKEGDWIGWPNPEKHGPENSRHDRSSDQPRSQPGLQRSACLHISNREACVLNESVQRTLRFIRPQNILGPTENSGDHLASRFAQQSLIPHALSY